MQPVSSSGDERPGFAMTVRIDAESRMLSRVFNVGNERTTAQPVIHEEGAIRVCLAETSPGRAVISAAVIVGNRCTPVMSPAACRIDRACDETENGEHIDVWRESSPGGERMPLLAATLRPGGRAAFLRCGLLSLLGLPGGTYDPPRIESMRDAAAASSTDV